VNHRYRWYLVAWDRDRQDWRTFRVDRLTRPASTGMRFAPHRLPANDAAAFVQQSITTAPNRFEARVMLYTAAEEVTRRIPAQWGTITPISTDSCEFRAGDDDLQWLAMRIALLGVDFEVQEPPELVEHLRELALRLTRATDPGGPER
jgi:predicted DNA-binding transcriptional regulator YafY